jgi:hypothetical protein
METTTIIIRRLTHAHKAGVTVPVIAVPEASRLRIVVRNAAMISESVQNKFDGSCCISDEN